ncbi:hypothetical protein VM98_35570, partial [Streptomyces rubellomurinus subsp. indigoferus]
ALLVPRLRRAPSLPTAPPPPELDADGTVLLTVGTGALGALVARHLVAAYGGRPLLLVSRRGEAAPAPRDLREDLSAARPRATFPVFAFAARPSLVRVISPVRASHPLTRMVHLHAA